METASSDEGRHCDKIPLSVVKTASSDKGGHCANRGDGNARYDVFIIGDGNVAFRHYMMYSLQRNGFRTFLHDRELELGDANVPAIENIISSSKVQIAIFSPLFAGSPWRLDELIHMLETLDHARFIPVFCDVKRSDLRYPDKGVYADAFAKLEEEGRFSNQRLREWKAALFESSLISGYRFSNQRPHDDVEEMCAFDSDGEEMCAFDSDVEEMCALIFKTVQKVVRKSKSSAQRFRPYLPGRRFTSNYLPPYLPGRRFTSNYLPGRRFTSYYLPGRCVHFWYPRLWRK